MSNLETVTIYKNTSVSKSNLGCLFPLHSLEPIGIEVIAQTQVSITISGDSITGTVALYIHDTGNVRYIQNISTGVKTTINLTTLGGMFFDINSVQYQPNNNIAFKFNIEIELVSSSYKINPIFDIRTEKISVNNINDPSVFKEAVLASSNGEYGMLMISSNVRVYMPKSKYIPQWFNPNDSLNLMEDVFRIYNQLNGLKPRVGFLLASARSEHVGYGSAGSTMMDTGPESSSFYMGPGWGLYHECGHMFEGWWSTVEVWTNMYSKFMQARNGGFVWLWGNDRLSYETNNIKPLYQNYIVNNVYSEFGAGLYFYISLEQAFGSNFVFKTERYAKDNSIPTSGYFYAIYSLMKNYALNGLPYGEIYGQYIYDTNLINDIIDNSKGTFWYIPENPSFDAYRNISAPVTTKYVYVENLVINGMSNPNSEVKIKILNNEYKVNTDINSKFTFTIPVSLTVTDSITITSKEVGKIQSPPKIIYPVNHLVDSIITFYGLANYLIAQIRFNVNNNTLSVSSTGAEAHSYFGSQEYFGVSLQDSTGNVKVNSGVQGVQNANDFKSILNNQSFSYSDVLIIRGLEKNRVAITNYNGGNYNPQTYPEGFRLRTTGLIAQFDYLNNTITFLGLGNYEIARIKFNITNNTLEVSSTGTQAHFYFGNQEYFGIELQGEQGVSKVSIGVQGVENANNFKDTLNNYQFIYGDKLIIRSLEQNRVSITNFNGASRYNPKSSSEKFGITNNGLTIAQ